MCIRDSLKALADIAHANGAMLIVDNTFMTGCLAKPLSMGADLEVISLTKDVYKRQG